jgi:glutamine amidotransferase
MTRTHRTSVVGIVDYKAGNVQSIGKAFLHVGARIVKVHGVDDFASCTHLVLPGVGAFGFCADKLGDSGLVPRLRSWALEERRPLLGICVGMQLLSDCSEESPHATGLGWIGGEVKRIPVEEGIRVPHVGWNSVVFGRRFGAFAAGSSADFYFDHSYAYHIPRDGAVMGSCTHGVTFSAVIARDNITAVQFHPEKSQSSGLRFLDGFLAQ